MKLWLTLMLTFAIGAAQAQAIWRCGSEGRTYSDTPCREGQAIEVAEARPTTDLASAQAQAGRDRAWAAQLARERQAIEARPATGAAGIRGSRLAASAEPVRRKPQAMAKSKPQTEAAGIWRATAPASRHVKD